VLKFNFKIMYLATGIVTVEIVRDIKVIMTAYLPRQYIEGCGQFWAPAALPPGKV
jgi:hypothetical protein